MYGHMYNEKLQPLVDIAHEAARQKYKKKNPEGIKYPLRMLSWNAIAKQHWAKESDEIKKLVIDAGEERMLKKKEDEDGEVLGEKIVMTKLEG